jgi:hypothetical protein
MFEDDRQTMYPVSRSVKQKINLIDWALSLLQGRGPKQSIATASQGLKAGFTTPLDRCDFVGGFVTLQL